MHFAVSAVERVRPRLGLSSSLVLATISVLAALMVVDGWLDIRREQAIFWDDLSQRSHMLADSLQDVLANPLYRDDIAWADDATKLFAGHTGVNYIQVFGADGRLLTDTRVWSYPIGEAGDEYILRALAGQRSTSFLGPEEGLSLATPITVGREVVGVANLNLSTSTLQENINGIIAQQLWQGTILVTIGALFAFLLGQYICRPVKRLALAAKRVGEGEFAPPFATGRTDEIGDLAQALEEMSGKVKERTDQLQRAKDELEEKVAERTAAFQASNVRLLAEIEERERLQDQLLQTQKIESIGRLAGGIAHDFNNMLTPIIGYAQLGKGKLPPGNSLLHDLDEIQKAAERATNLTSQLLAFSRRQNIEPRVINLNHLIVDTGNMLRHLIREDIQLAMLLRSEMKLVKVDPTQVEQVLVNLVINASDAMPNGGNLTIGTSDITLDQDADIEPGNYVMLEVSDNGVGMTDEVRAHVFEPFFTTKEVGQGTGLGLATCYGIVKQAGGHISVCGELGRGTSFKIYFPVADEGIKKLPLSSEPATLPLGEETVLLVEDEEMVRSLATHILREQGYSVLEAANGVEALAVAEEYSGEEIHLLLTDVVMPEMGGRELADRLMTTRPRTKVLYCSGYTEDVFFNVGVLEHETAFLPKPFSPPALALKVRKVLDS